MARQDPTLEVKEQSDTGQYVISGMGELHLEVMVNRLLRERNLAVRVGQPRVSYRETIGRRAEAEGRFVRQLGQQSHFAVVRLAVEPYQPAAGEEAVRFDNRVSGEELRPEWSAAVRTGVLEAAGSGALLGYPVLNVRVTLLGVEQHEQESSETAFENAARMAFDEALRQAEPLLMEPLMKLEVVCPETSFGTVNGDLSSRRAVITHTEPRGQQRVIDAEIPLAEAVGYVSAVRSLTQGRATATMEFLRYAVVPAAVAAPMLEQYGA